MRIICSGLRLVKNFHLLSLNKSEISTLGDFPIGSIDSVSKLKNHDFKSTRASGFLPTVTSSKDFIKIKSVPIDYSKRRVTAKNFQNVGTLSVIRRFLTQKYSANHMKINYLLKQENRILELMNQFKLDQDKKRFSLVKKSGPNFFKKSLNEESNQTESDLMVKYNTEVRRYVQPFGLF